MPGSLSLLITLTDGFQCYEIGPRGYILARKIHSGVKLVAWVEEFKEIQTAKAMMIMMMMIMMSIIMIMMSLAKVLLIG